jgi:hypothetical protein
MIDIKELEKLAQKLKEELEKTDELKGFEINKKNYKLLERRLLIGHCIKENDSLHDGAILAIGKYRSIKGMGLIYAQKKVV